MAKRENRANTSRRSAGAAGQTATAIATRPPIQSETAERCTQSASSLFQEEPGSTASCPESESPPAKKSASTSAGTSSDVRSSSQERYTSAATSANPSVITTNAFPYLVPPEIGERSP